MVVPLMIAAACFPPFCLAAICAVVGGTVVGLGVFGAVPGLMPGAQAEGGLQLSVAVAVMLPFLAGLLIEQVRGDRRRIAESEQRFRRAMTDSAIGIALVGLDGQILETNKVFAALL